MAVLGIPCPTLPGDDIAEGSQIEYGKIGALQRESSSSSSSMNLPSTAEIDDYLGLGGGLSEKITKSDIDNMKAEVVAPIDQRCSPLELFDEEAEELRLSWVV